MESVTGKQRIRWAMILATGVVILGAYWYQSQDTNPEVDSGSHQLSGRDPTDSRRPESEGGWSPRRHQDPTVEQHQNRSLVMDRPLEDSSGPSASGMSLRSLTSRNSKEAPHRMVQFAKNYARISQECDQGLKSACDQLNKDGGKAKKGLATIQAKLTKSCEESDIRSCISLGDVNRAAGNVGDSRKAYEKAKNLVEVTQSRCQRGEESSPTKCKKAPKMLKFIETRVSRVVAP